MRIIVCGGAGFIGGHLVRYLRAEGHTVLAFDIKFPDFGPSAASQFHRVDLRKFDAFERHFVEVDEVYQLAADMGGAGFVFTGENDAAILRNSTLINLNVLEACRRHKVGCVFFSSSACIYPEQIQRDTSHCSLSEDMAYPANPDSDYGWEKLFSERLYQAYARNYGMNVRIARYHNVYGPEGTFEGGREKAPAAICRKIAQLRPGDELEIWGDGQQTRSFLYVDDCVDATLALMRSSCTKVLNIGSEEMVSIEQMARMVGRIAGKEFGLRHTVGPLGVRGRNSDNTRIRRHLNWEPKWELELGLARTYNWIEAQLRPRDVFHSDHSKVLTGP